MKSEERSLMGIVLALSAEFDFKAKITPASIYDLMRRTRAILPADASDIFRTYDSVEKVKNSLDYLAQIKLMKEENGEYNLGGVGIMRASGVCLNPTYGKAARSVTKDWFSRWERK